MIDDEIKQVLVEHGRLAVDPASLSEDADLYRLGMTSHASVNVMLGLEARFGIEFPPEMLRKRTFESVGTIRAALNMLIPASA